MLAWLRSLMKRLCGSSLRLLGPGAEQVVVDRRAAAGAAVGRAPVQCAVDARRCVSRCCARMASRTSWWPCVGAAAHGLLLGRGRVVAAGGEHQICSTRPVHEPQERAGLGVLAHLVQREQALVLDRLADRALAHAVAAADLVAVGHGGGLVLALVAGVADVAIRRTSACRGCRRRLRPSRSSLKYQLPSTVSPYRQAPTSLSSLITSFL